MAWFEESGTGEPAWVGNGEDKKPEMMLPTWTYFYESHGDQIIWMQEDVNLGYDAEALPAIQSVVVKPGGVVLTLKISDKAGQVLDLFYQDVELPEGFDPKASWKILARGIQTGSGEFHEIDDLGDADRTAPQTPDLRLYQVGDARLDTDQDGLSDSMEQLVTGTDPANADMDADGLLDGDEYERGTDYTLADTDGDGMTDGDEIAHRFNPLQPDNPAVKFSVFTPLR
jgi:hypothetical protein